jgi:streptogrisin D
METTCVKPTSTRSAWSTSRPLAVTVALFAVVLVPLPATASTGASTDPGPEVTAVVRSLGDRTAGFYDDAAARTTVVTVTDPADAAAVRRAGATPKRVERSQADLDRITDTLYREARIPGTAWAVDVPTNQVVVSYDDTVSGAGFARVRSVAARFSDAVRLSRTPGVIRPYVSGGEYVYGEGGIRCVLSFNVRDSAGGQFFLTAGHCTNTEAFWYADPGHTVPLGPTAGSSFPGNDYGIVRYTNTSIAKPGNVRLNSTSYQDITGAGSPYVGQSVRTVSSTTGLRSGTVTALNVTVNYAQGTVSGLIKTSICAEPGLSGAPLFAGSTALGILSGGSGSCTTGGVTYFQPVTEALAAYGVSVY